MTAWRPVPDYEGRYEVSDDGQVWSIGRWVRHRGEGQHWRPSRMLTPCPGTDDRLRVSLVGDDQQKRSLQVHRLVLLAFVGEPPPDKPRGLHGDGDHRNNRLTNLRWGSDSDNQNDAVRHGTHVQARKKTCKRGHRYEGRNLRTSELPKRKCRSCLYARRDVRDAIAAGLPAPDVQELSDQWFTWITEREVA